MNAARVFFTIFAPLFVVIDPAGTLPLFLALTERFPAEGRRRVARLATITAGATAIGFLIGGQALLRFVGVRFSDFQIAGGLLLVVLAVVDLLGFGKPMAQEHQLEQAGEQALASMAVAPLAIPLIVGPATLTTSLLLVSTYAPVYGVARTDLLVALALITNLLILFVAMWHSEWLVRLIGRQVLSVINKIVMILLAAIAVSLIREGVLDVVRQARQIR